MLTVTSALDAAGVGQLARKLGLVREEQLHQAWEEVGRDAEPAILVAALQRKGFLTPYQGQKLLKGETDGYFLGGYRLLYRIASGSFGRVYRADDPRSGQVVAIKVLRRRWSEDPQKVALFYREGKVGATLQHPNIVEILNVSQDPVTGQHFLVMEFVEGGNLREVLASCKKFEPPKAFKLIEDAAAGLAHAFGKGLTHRDVKLSNILVSSQGVAKLVDFGLAGVCEGGDTSVDRTVDYAGLERLTGVKTGDVRSDIYFLGCVLYEMLSGRSPLEMTRDRQARMNPQRFTEVRPLSQQDLDAPAQVFQLVETMMSLRPEHRYQTPSQLLDAVRATRAHVEGGEGKQAGPASIYVVEGSERLQELIRDKFKHYGFRVLMAVDPARALERYRQQPYDALVIDAETVGADGVTFFDRIVQEAERVHQKLAAILILSEEQAELQARVKQRPNSAVLVRPVTMKQLHHKLHELIEGR